MMDKPAGRGRGTRRLKAASIILELPNEPRQSQRWLVKDSSSTAHDFITSSHLMERDIRGRTSQLFKHQHQAEVSEISQGSTSGTGRAKENILFGESLIAPGIPVVYRPTEERMVNPDRLNLDRRNLRVCPILEGEEHLRLLNLQHNAISHIQHLGSLRRLVFLDLYDNQIEEINGLDGLHSLRVLMLGRNRIHHITGLQALVRLDVLDLHGNMIKYITNLDHLIHLRVLNLAGNDITVVQGLSGLGSLAELNLRRNRITNCDVGDLPLLQRLFLSHNLIESIDDIAGSANCPRLVDLSIDGNPIANSYDYRSVILSCFTELTTLNQHPVTDEEKREVLLVSRPEELKLKELHEQLKLKEERDHFIAIVKREWEVGLKLGSEFTYIRSYIESESHTMTLYGNPCSELIKSDRFPHITHLSLYFIEVDNLINTVPHVRDTLPVLQNLECHSMNISTLLELQRLIHWLPPTLTSFFLNKDGNPVTDHPFYSHWMTYLLPQTTVAGIDDVNISKHTFVPFGLLNAASKYADQECNNPDTLEYGQTFAKSIVRSTLVSHQKALAFEKAWPELIHQLVKEIVAIDPN